MTAAITTKAATTAAPVQPLLAHRWSSCGFDVTYTRDDTLTPLLEAARWAPSANNSQPWRFLVTRRGEQGFSQLTGVLAAGNRSWAPASSALILVAAQSADETGRPRPRCTKPVRRSPCRPSPPGSRCISSAASTPMRPAKPLISTTPSPQSSSRPAATTRTHSCPSRSPHVSRRPDPREPLEALLLAHPADLTRGRRAA